MQLVNLDLPTKFSLMLPSKLSMIHFHFHSCRKKKLWCMYELRIVNYKSRWLHWHTGILLLLSRHNCLLLFCFRVFFFFFAQHFSICTMLIYSFICSFVRKMLRWPLLLMEYIHNTFSIPISILYHYRNCQYYMSSLISMLAATTTFYYSLAQSYQQSSK